MSSADQIDFNQKTHDSVYKKYENIHPEIFSKLEQERLKNTLQEAKQIVATGSNPIRALDVGCGSGNLTRHLLELGCEVTAADISENFLTLVKSISSEIDTHKLNGEDLSELPGDSFDMVVTYSVLHHIPDYLKMVSEMGRVLKPGGVLYIDHEKNSNYWDREAVLQEFYDKQKRYLLPHKLKRLLHPLWYVHRFRRLKNPRYQAEGDIHVWPDDHIEWDKVYQTAATHGVFVIEEKDFLLFNDQYDRSIYHEYQGKTTDTRAVIFKKHG